jgi:hypothetical protein
MDAYAHSVQNPVSSTAQFHKQIWMANVEKLKMLQSPRTENKKSPWYTTSI